MCFALWPDCYAPAALASLLFDPPEPQIIGKTQCFGTFLPFRAPGSSFFWLSLLWSSFFFSSLLFSSLLFSSLALPISAFHLPILSEVWLLNFLRSTHSYRRLTHLFIPSMNSKWCKENVAEPPIKMAGKSMGSNPTTITHWNLLIKRSSSWWITHMFLCELRCLDLKSLLPLPYPCSFDEILGRQFLLKSTVLLTRLGHGTQFADSLAQRSVSNAGRLRGTGGFHLNHQHRDFVSWNFTGFNWIYYDFMGCIWIHDS